MNGWSASVMDEQLGYERLPAPLLADACDLIGFCMRITICDTGVPGVLGPRVSHVGLQSLGRNAFS